MKNLIFFDINGTIVERDDRTDLPFTLAANQLLNTENAMKNIDNSARSDHDVFKEILRNFSVRYTDHIWNEFLGLYENELKKYKSADIWRENADIINFLEKLTNTNHTLSLITGELKIGAKYKLEKLGIWDFFENGGFGEHGLKRFDIAKHALSYYKNHIDEYDNIYIIGDTTLDIQTARHIGATIISITTGSHSKEKLLSQNPDYIIDNFSEIYNLFL